MKKLRMFEINAISSKIELDFYRMYDKKIEDAIRSDKELVKFAKEISDMRDTYKILQSKIDFLNHKLKLMVDEFAESRGVNLQYVLKKLCNVPDKWENIAKKFVNSTKKREFVSIDDIRYLVTIKSMDNESASELIGSVLKELDELINKELNEKGK